MVVLHLIQQRGEEIKTCYTISHVTKKIKGLQTLNHDVITF